MTCTEPNCTGLALRYVGRRFFCDAHRDEAYAAANKENLQSASIASVNRFQFDSRRIGRENPKPDHV